MSRFGSREALVFRAATAVLLVHALDDAFLHRQPGLGIGQHALAALLALAVGIGGMVAFPSLRPGLRAGLAFSLGALGVMNGAMHLEHLGAEGAEAGDLTGVLAALAGLMLVGLAAAIPFLHRGERAATARRRWRNRAIAVAAGLLAVVFVIGPASMAMIDAHKWREPIGAAPSAAYRPVTFEASDGLELSGWYRPSRNGAAVLLVHGGGGNRMGSLRHAEMLARHGYGVLLYDARGRGESDGSPNGYGWDWQKDVAGALGFLERRADVERGRIGALGLSTGADVLIDVAAQRDDISAVVADGAAAMSWEDWRRVRGTADLGAVAGWVMFKSIEVLTGDHPPAALEDQAARIDSPLMLISGQRLDEYDFNVRYAAAAGGPVEHWNLPDVSHTRGLRERPEEYERRVAAFFDAALLAPAPRSSAL